MSNPMKVPPALAEQAFEKNGRKFLLIQAAVIVEVEASEDALSPHIVDGMVVFNDPSYPQADHANERPKYLGWHLPHGQTAMLVPALGEGATLEAQLLHHDEMLERTARNYLKHLESESS